MNRLTSFITSGLFLVLVAYMLTMSNLQAQTYDTISNWDGISQNWYVSAGVGYVVDNPAPDGVNSSARCLQVKTTVSMWDHISYTMPEPANFDSFPRYRLKVLAPVTGGNVTFKFENSDNSYFHEIVITPTPGVWSDLTFDFSGLNYDNLTRIVIFYDFHGTTSGINWYIDDVLKEIPPPIYFESNLPIVVIETNNQAIPDEPKIPATMGIIDNGPGIMNHTDDPFNDYDGHIGIETRGQSTQMFPKKSYAFETRDSQGENLDVSLLGMPAENDWILYAPYTDKSMLRNIISFEMGRRMGHYCTRTILCELVVNNDYKGVYVMEEKIKKDEGRVDIATLKPDEISGNDLTGGYILRVDKRDPDFTLGVDGWKSNPVPPYPNAMDIIFQYYYPEPDEIVEQQCVYIKNYVTTAENTLTSTDFKNPETGYQQFFDVASFIDFMLLNEISKEVDKYRYSNYLYKEKDSDGGKLFAGPAWDFNLGYGNVDYWPPGLETTGWLYEMVEVHEWSIMFWWKRLMEDNYFKGLAKTRWAQLREQKLSNSAIQTVIDSVIQYTEVARERNFDRWPILGQYVWPNHDWYNNTYEDEVDYFQDYLFNRMNWMDTHISGQAMIPGITITAEANMISVKIFGDYFSTNQLKKEYFTLNDAPSGTSIQSVTYGDVNECTLTLNTIVTGATDLSVTLSEEAINSWEDLTSNKLETAGVHDLGLSKSQLQVFVTDNQLNIRSSKPEFLPADAQILDISGKVVAGISLEKTNDQSYPLQLKKGVYLINFFTDNGKVTIRFLL
ncbi:MAG: Fibronectin type III domain protein [Bacteroidetes bacterium]|nr:MAG: Fibronectin type III domain protein [Bacteroidota bacterium]